MILLETHALDYHGVHYVHLAFTVIRSYIDAFETHVSQGFILLETDVNQYVVMAPTGSMANASETQAIMIMIMRLKCKL